MERFSLLSIFISPVFQPLQRCHVIVESFQRHNLGQNMSTTLVLSLPKPTSLTSKLKCIVSSPLIKMFFIVQGTNTIITLSCEHMFFTASIISSTLVAESTETIILSRKKRLTPRSAIKVHISMKFTFSFLNSIYIWESFVLNSIHS